MKIDVLNNRAEQFNILAQTYIDESDYEMGRYYQGVADGIREACNLITGATERLRFKV